MGQGRNAYLTDGILRGLGRELQDFAEFPDGVTEQVGWRAGA